MSADRPTDKDASASLHTPAPEPHWQRRFLAKALPQGEPGRLNPDYTYYPLESGRELGMSALARAVMQWCHEPCSFERLFELACEHFPERGAVVEQELQRTITALAARGLLSEQD